MLHQPVEAATHPALAKAAGGRLAKAVVELQFSAGIEPKHRSVVPGSGGVVVDVVAQEHCQQYQLRLALAPIGLPGEQLLASAVGPHPKIQQLYAFWVGGRQGARTGAVHLVLQLLPPGLVLVHLKGLAEGVPQDCHPQDPIYWLGSVIPVAEASPVDAHPTTALLGPPALGAGPVAEAPYGVVEVEGRSGDARQPQGPLSQQQQDQHHPQVDGQQPGQGK
ncbi:MAG: hypothetical protein EBT26_04590 [Microbacteriaceae bacterium]|nr:hypothetical protein [Microbacteriaceae bacterium]